MMTNKITPSVDYSLWLKRLETQLNVPTNKNSIRVPNVVDQVKIIVTLWGLM